MCPRFGDMWGDFPMQVCYVSGFRGHVGQFPPAGAPCVLDLGTCGALSPAGVPCVRDLWTCGAVFPLLASHVSGVWGHMARFPHAGVPCVRSLGTCGEVTPCWCATCPVFMDMWGNYPLLVCHVSGFHGHVGQFPPAAAPCVRLFGTDVAIFGGFL